MKQCEYYVDGVIIMGRVNCTTEQYPLVKIWIYVDRVIQIVIVRVTQQP